MEQKRMMSEEQLARRRERNKRWNDAHREKQREYGRAFYWRNVEKRKAYSREYNQKHREERLAYGKEYYQRKKAEDPDYVKKLNTRAKERQEQRWAKWVESHHPLCDMSPEKLASQRESYFKRNKVRIYKRQLNEYIFTYMEKLKRQCPGRVDEYFIRYPFEDYGEKFIRIILRQYKIYSSRIEYAECYDAGLLAYLYSIHRCAILNCDYAIPYIWKMIRIYIKCALFIHNDAKNLCRENNFREIRLEAFEGNVC